MADDADQFQALYRRFRPQTFAGVVGQDHVTRALQNAVRENKVAHAYLFSGPRGTGKTSTARILAKALNCLNQKDGEPCGTCESCVAVTAGASFDVIELDAASNRGIDEVRDLIASASLVSGGRWRVFIVDEVHMLTGAAAAALLKTLEEPPGHVVFVLATTDPQKVSATIRSRTQHYEFRLLPNETLAALLSDVNKKAKLGLNEDTIEQVVRRGRGSARDALSTLDQAAAGGDFNDASASVLAIVEAIADRASEQVLLAVETSMQQGGSPRILGEELIALLRDVLLSAVAPTSLTLTEEEVAQYSEIARRFELPRITRAIEVIGDALRDMRDAMDQRIPLEVALVKIVVPESNMSVAGLASRVERLEQALAGATPLAEFVAPPAPVASSAAGSPRSSDGSPRSSDGSPRSSDGSPAAAARATLGGLTASAGGNTLASGAAASVGGSSRPRSINPKLVPAPEPEVKADNTQRLPRTPAPVVKSDSVLRAEAAMAATSGERVFPRVDELVMAWNDVVLDKLVQRAKARYRGGHWSKVDPANETALYALPNAPHRDRCAECIPDVEQSLADYFGRKISVELIVEDNNASSRASVQAAKDEEETSIGVDDLLPSDGQAKVMSAEQRLMQAFPGAEEVDPND